MGSGLRHEIPHRRAAPPEANAADPTPWPSLSADAELVRADGQLLAGFELGPLNLELLAEAEREASLEGLAALYDAIPRPFQLLSVPPHATRTTTWRTCRP